MKCSRTKGEVFFIFQLTTEPKTYSKIRRKTTTHTTDLHSDDTLTHTISAGHAMNITPFTQALQHAGFEIAHAFPIDALGTSCLETLPPLSSSTTCGILIGNTITAWQPFLLWLRQQPDWQGIADPFNAFSEHTIHTQCQKFFSPVRVLWTHETKSYIVPAQKIAHESGLAFRSAGQFNIHPQFGPWFALRALVLLDTTPKPEATEAQNPSSARIEEQASARFQELYKNLQHTTDIKTVQQQWKAWLTLRDIYKVGKEYRYTNPQIQYHYTHDKQVLAQELNRLSAANKIWSKSQP